MKKIIIVSIAVVFIAGIMYVNPVSAIGGWLSSGDDIYYNGGNVGIGTDSPSSTLTVSPATGMATIDLVPQSVNQGSMIGLGSTSATAEKSASVNFLENTVIKWSTYYSAIGDFFGIGRGTDSYDDPVLAISESNGGVGVNDEAPDFSLEVSDSVSKGYFGVSTERNADGDVLIINDQGNVGIGTTTPTEKLDVNGNIVVDTTSDICINGGKCLSSVIDGSSSLDNISVSPVGGLAWVDIKAQGVNSAANLSLNSTDADAEQAAYIDYSESSVSKWSIYYNALLDFIGFNRAGDALDSPVFAITDDDGAVGIYDGDADYTLEVAKSINKGYLGISSEKYSDGDVFVVNPDGNVGINKANPTEKLEVGGNIKVGADNDICIEGGNCLSNVLDTSSSLDSLSIAPEEGLAILKIIPQADNVAGEIRLHSTDANAEKSGAINFTESNQPRWSMYYSAIGDFLGFGGGQNSYDQPSMAFNDTTGNVGIFDTTADYSLEIAKSSGQGYLAVSSEANNDGDLFVVDSNQNVGISNNTPTEKLDVNGNVKISGNIVSAGDICIGNCE